MNLQPRCSQHQRFMYKSRLIYAYCFTTVLHFMWQTVLKRCWVLIILQDWTSIILKHLQLFNYLEEIQCTNLRYFQSEAYGLLSCDQMSTLIHSLLDLKCKSWQQHPSFDRLHAQLFNIHRQVATIYLPLKPLTSPFWKTGKRGKPVVEEGFSKKE